MNGFAALTVGSVCSGVGGLDRGLHRAGYQVRWHCEQDRYRLKHPTPKPRKDVEP